MLIEQYRLPIPCMVYSRNTGGSCAANRSRNVRNVLGTSNIEKAFHRCANVCVRSSDAYA